MADAYSKDSEQIQKAIQELQILEGILLEKAPLTGKGDSDQNLALIKVFKGLTEERLNSILRKADIDPSWIPLSLNGNKYSTVINLLLTIENLSMARDKDPLTGLYNRGYFQRMLEREMEKTFVYKMPLTLAILDIDDFKLVNDVHGHVCGDKILKYLAVILGSRIRSGDCAARIGGEEFALILPGTGKVKSEPLLERILQNFRKCDVSCGESGAKPTCTLSIGSATYKGRARLSPEDLLSQADKELYFVKNSGKNSISSVSAVEAIDSKSMVRRDEKDFLLKG